MIYIYKLNFGNDKKTKFFFQKFPSFPVNKIQIIEQSPNLEWSVCKAPTQNCIEVGRNYEFDYYRHALSKEFIYATRIKIYKSSKHILGHVEEI